MNLLSNWLTGNNVTDLCLVSAQVLVINRTYVDTASELFSNFSIDLNLLFLQPAECQLGISLFTNRLCWMPSPQSMSLHRGP